jgi:hypothetical protein
LDTDEPAGLVEVEDLVHRAKLDDDGAAGRNRSAHTGSSAVGHERDPVLVRPLDHRYNLSSVLWSHYALGQKRRFAAPFGKQTAGREITRVARKVQLVGRYPVGAEEPRELVCRGHTRSTIVAIPCPTPMHIVASP